ITKKRNWTTSCVSDPLEQQGVQIPKSKIPEPREHRRQMADARWQMADAKRQFEHGHRAA
ncbi:MAG: hypothetical protein ACXVBY_03360, partial [Isosphaeraceae bacterium]